jgi:hypothetical protein
MDESEIIREAMRLLGKIYRASDPKASPFAEDQRFLGTIQ